MELIIINGICSENKIEYKGNIERIIKAKSRFFNDYLNR